MSSRRSSPFLVAPFITSVGSAARSADAQLTACGSNTGTGYNDGTKTAKMLGYPPTRMPISNLQIFGTKKCPDTRKAERFFKERRLSFQLIDIAVTREP